MSLTIMAGGKENIVALRHLRWGRKDKYHQNHRRLIAIQEL